MEVTRCEKNFIEIILEIITISLWMAAEGYQIERLKLMHRIEQRFVLNQSVCT
jgi:hypothetical protein